jgi:uncharacterized membrane-anchored protein YitT (DUF2179 family)
MTKYEFGEILFYIDIACILISVIMINLLEYRYKEYAEIFDKRSVEMRDFTVQIDNLPLDHEYGGTDIMLKAFLWAHIEKFVRKAFEDKLIKSGNEDKLREVRISEPW